MSHSIKSQRATPHDSPELAARRRIYAPESLTRILPAAKSSPAIRAMSLSRAPQTVTIEYTINIFQMFVFSDRAVAGSLPEKVRQKVLTSLLSKGEGNVIPLEIELLVRQAVRRTIGTQAHKIEISPSGINLHLSIDFTLDELLALGPDIDSQLLSRIHRSISRALKYALAAKVPRTRLTPKRLILGWIYNGLTGSTKDLVVTEDSIWTPVRGRQGQDISHILKHSSTEIATRTSSGLILVRKGIWATSAETQRTIARLFPIIPGKIELTTEEIPPYKERI